MPLMLIPQVPVPELREPPSKGDTVLTESAFSTPLAKMDRVVLAPTVTQVIEAEKSTKYVPAPGVNVIPAIKTAEAFIVVVLTAEEASKLMFLIKDSSTAA